MTPENNAIKYNYVKVEVDITHENIKCSLWGDRDETINHIIEYSKLMQKY